MKHLGKFLTDTADQIISTLVLSFLVYSIVNGAITLINHPPETLVIIGLVLFGFALGVFKFLSNETTIKNNEEDDRED